MTNVMRKYGKEKNLSSYYRNYIGNPDKTDIYSVYARPSIAKVNAFRRCKEFAKKFGSDEIRILSHTCQFFTVGFVYIEPTTGEYCFCVDTGRNIYFWEM